MLATVDPQEYAARRARLGITSAPKVIPRSAIKPAPPTYAETPLPYREPDIVPEISPNEIGPYWIKSSRFILEMTAKKYGVSIAEIKGVRRDKNIIKARHECFYRMSKELGYSLPKIGKIVGGKDHTSVLSGIRRHELRLKDPQIDERPTQGR